MDLTPRSESPADPSPEGTADEKTSVEQVEEGGTGDEKTSVEQVEEGPEPQPSTSAQMDEAAAMAASGGETKEPPQLTPMSKPTKSRIAKPRPAPATAALGFLPPAVSSSSSTGAVRKHKGVKVGGAPQPSISTLPEVTAGEAVSVAARDISPQPRPSTSGHVDEAAGFFGQPVTTGTRRELKPLKPFSLETLPPALATGAALTRNPKYVKSSGSTASSTGAIKKRKDIKGATPQTKTSTRALPETTAGETASVARRDISPQLEAATYVHVDEATGTIGLINIQPGPTSAPFAVDTRTASRYLNPFTLGTGPHAPSTGAIKKHEGVKVGSKIPMRALPHAAIGEVRRDSLPPPGPSTYICIQDVADFFKAMELRTEPLAAPVARDTLKKSKFYMQSTLETAPPARSTGAIKKHKGAKVGPTPQSKASTRAFPEVTTDEAAALAPRDSSPQPGPSTHVHIDQVAGFFGPVDIQPGPSTAPFADIRRKSKFVKPFTLQTTSPASATGAIKKHKGRKMEHSTSSSSNERGPYLAPTATISIAEPQASTSAEPAYVPSESIYTEPIPSTSASTGPHFKKKREDKLRRRDHRNLDNVMKNIQDFDEPLKFTALAEKYSELYDEYRVSQNQLSFTERQNTALLRENNQLNNEQTKLVLSRSRMENVCRELQKQNRLIKEENNAKIREEEERRKETAAKFQVTLNEVTSMMQDSSEQNLQLRDDNISMANKIAALCEQFDKREEDIGKSSRQLELEKQLAEARLNKVKMEYEAVLERFKVEKEISGNERDLLNSELKQWGDRCAQLDLSNRLQEQELQMYRQKYEEFEATMSKSARTFASFKEEMNRKAKEKAAAEKDAQAWKEKYNIAVQANAELTELNDSRTAELSTIKKQAVTFHGVTRQLQSERSVYLQLLRQNNIPVPQTRPAESPNDDITLRRKEIQLAELKAELMAIQRQMEGFQPPENRSPTSEGQLCTQDAERQPGTSRDEVACVQEEAVPIEVLCVDPDFLFEISQENAQEDTACQTEGLTVDVNETDARDENSRTIGQEHEDSVSDTPIEESDTSVQSSEAEASQQQSQG